MGRGFHLRFMAGYGIFVGLDAMYMKSLNSKTELRTQIPKFSNKVHH